MKEWRTAAEWTAEEWAVRTGRLAKMQAIHGCCGSFDCRTEEHAPECQHVFRCRPTPGLPIVSACYDFYGACLGGSEDDRCANCNTKYLGLLRKALVRAVKAKAWRSEPSLCREFGGGDHHIPTEDVLYELVRDGVLEWFGDNERPLRYRVRKKAKVHEGGSVTKRPLTEKQIQAKERQARLFRRKKIQERMAAL